MADPRKYVAMDESTKTLVKYALILAVVFLVVRELSKRA